MVKFNKIGVVGAGMVGAGIAYTVRLRGMKVILIDKEIEFVIKR